MSDSNISKNTATEHHGAHHETATAEPSEHEGDPEIHHPIHEDHENSHRITENGPKDRRTDMKTNRISTTLVTFAPAALLVCALCGPVAASRPQDPFVGSPGQPPVTAPSAGCTVSGIPCDEEKIIGEPPSAPFVGAPNSDEPIISLPNAASPLIGLPGDDNPVIDLPNTASPVSVAPYSDDPIIISGQPDEPIIITPNTEPTPATPDPGALPFVPGSDL